MKTRVRSNIDLDAKGVHHGSLFVPLSSDESAYGAVTIPISVINGRPGPSVLLTGAVHGDEFEGPIVLRRLARELAPEAVDGRLILMPYANPPALRAGRRTSPLDGANLNRIFPGRADGGPSDQIAHFITHHLLPRVDTLIDLHSGGRSLLYTPLAATHVTGDPDRDSISIAALKSFGAPIGLLATDLDTQGLLDYTAESMGKMVISTELGGAGIFSPAAARIGERGVRGLLHHLGVLAQPPADAAPSRLMETPRASCFSVAHLPGLYEPAIEIAGTVSAGDVVGLIHSLEDCASEPAAIVAAESGTLICRRAQGIVVQGDCVAIVAQDSHR